MNTLIRRRMTEAACLFIFWAAGIMVHFYPVFLGKFDRLMGDEQDSRLILKVG